MKVFQNKYFYDFDTFMLSIHKIIGPTIRWWGWDHPSKSGWYPPCMHSTTVSSTVSWWRENSWLWMKSTSWANLALECFGIIYIYVYIYMCVCVYVCVHIRIRIRYIYIYAHMYIYYVYMYIYTYTYVCTWFMYTHFITQNMGID